MIRKDNRNRHMRKLIGIILMVISMFTIYGCSEDEALVERSVDGVAVYLGYYDGVDY